jgi:DNA-binding CsgD family transcriptional regulator
VANLKANALVAVVKLLGQASCPNTDWSVIQRKRHLFGGLCSLAAADAWAWGMGAVAPEGNGESFAVSALEGGWRSSNERDKVSRALNHPAMRPLIKKTLYDAVIRKRNLTITRQKLMSDDKWRASPVGRMCREAGFDRFLASIRPLGSHSYSGLILYRRVTAPAFSPSERHLVHAVFQHIDWVHEDPIVEAASQPFPELTPRERQVMLLLLGGDSRKQLAAKLALSEHTVADHLKGIYRKLGVRSRAELLAKFLRKSV